jgi:hypothetical protein
VLATVQVLGLGTSTLVRFFNDGLKDRIPQVLKLYLCKTQVHKIRSFAVFFALCRVYITLVPEKVPT